MKRKIAVMGAGSFGTALAAALSVNASEIRLWDRKPELVKVLNETRVNEKYLAGVTLPENVTAYSDAKEVLSGADMAVYVIPAQGFRGVFESTCGMLGEDTVVVNCAKGIEQKTLMTMSEIAREIKPDVTYAVVSGPSHAEEVGRFLPTTLTVASRDPDVALLVQDAFMTEFLRVYTSGDVTGVELGGALKNIIALGTGILDGLERGDNAKAAMMTRGIAEIKRLGIAMGAEAETFAGLSGIGDLIVTCTSMHSRNRRCGILLGRGTDPKEAVESVGMVVEGIYTAEAAFELAKKYGVEMPITEQICRIISGEASAVDATDMLMKRERKSESDPVKKDC